MNLHFVNHFGIQLHTNYYELYDPHLLSIFSEMWQEHASYLKQLTPLHKRYLQVFTTGLPSVLLSEWLSTRLCFPGWGGGKKRKKREKRSKRYIQMDRQIFIKWKYIRYIWILHQQQFIGKNATAALQLKKKGQRIYIWANAFTSTTIT